MSGLSSNVSPGDSRYGNASPARIPYDEEKTMHVQDADLDDTYPGLVECAPFPSLASVDDITRTLSRTRTNQTQRSSTTKSNKVPDDRASDWTAAEGEQEEQPKQPAQGEAYWTEGIRNPGWLCVVSTFLVNFTVFGTVYAWGNFQQLYLNEVYKGQTNELKIAFVGTSSNALLLSTGLLITPLIQRIGYRGCMAIGAILAPLGLVLASYAIQLWHVYLSQGILFGIGASFVFSPSITLPSQWFLKNRALATGLAVSGSGVGGVCLSPMSQLLISTAGYRMALRALGGLGFGLLCIATALAHARYPPSKTNTKWWDFIDKSCFNLPFCFFLVFGLIVPFGYVAPFFLAPTYATSIGVDQGRGSTLVSIMSAANVVCRISLGFVGDRYGRMNTMAIFTLISGLATMLVWQFSNSYGVFVVYCVIFGLTGGGFVSLMPPVTADIVGLEKIQKGVGMAYVATMFGNLLGTPIAGQLLSQHGWTAAIQFAGSMTTASALVFLVVRFMMSPKIFKRI